MRAQEFENSKDTFVDIFRKFLPLAMKIIGLDSLPKIVFEKEIESPEQPTFGQYINDEHVLYVGLANRHPNDILRTVAHELVHYYQDTEHKLNDMSGTTGSPEENEANALAGVVMRNFNKLYPEYLKVKPIVVESWSEKYKRSINCSNPKGFSQRAHCQGRKKDESIEEKLNRTGSNELVIFDIDDTLLHTTAQIKVIDSETGKPKLSLTNQQFNNYKLKPGEEFDFGEFRDAAKFEEESVPIGPMLDKLRSDLAAGKNVVMLTARADFDNQKVVWRTFKRHGIDINQDVHLYRAGNQPGDSSPAVKKAIHVSEWLSSGKYNRVVMYDDSEKNLSVFKSLEKRFPNVEFEAHHVSEKGDTRQIESAGDRGDIPTSPGEQLIPFPQGTTMVDVSDIYDWYKLGMVISDLDDADPKMFGQGAPHTVIAFGSEEEEHKLLPLLKRLGLTVHDIDRPEDVKKAIPAKMLARDLAETIRKVGSQYRLVSKKGKNLGTYPTHAGAEKRERQVQYFKHVGEETLEESKSAPLYHFTSWTNLIKILTLNQLFSPRGKIYLTRDYTRQFLPHAEQLFKQPYGIRLNQELLSRDYGRKLQAGGQDIGWDEKKRQAWLADPKNAREIELVKQTGRGSGSVYDGADPVDIVRGTISQARRWESEEHLNVKNLPNLDKYITGVVIGKALGSVHRTKEIDPDPLTKLADILIHLFSGPKGFDQRNWFLDTTAKLGVPIIYDRKEYDPAQVKKRIIQLYSQRKKEREEEQSKPQKDFMVITSPAGGGIVTGGSDINAVFNKLVKDPRHTNREIYGYSIGLGPNAEKNMFDQPIPLIQLVKNSQFVGENFDKEADSWKKWQLDNLDPKMDMLSRLVKGWLPTKADHISAIEAGYNAMRKTGDVNQAAKAISDTFKEIQRRQGVAENFADGRNPQDKGDSARHGIRKGMTIAQLKKVRSSDSASPRKKQLAHWQINMRQGRKK